MCDFIKIFRVFSKRCFFAVLICLLQVGCASFKLAEDTEYKETVEHFLMTEDGKKVVFLGKKYHYIIDASPELNSLLSWHNRHLIQPYFKLLEVDRENQLTGFYELYVSTENLPKTEVRWLEQQGLEKSTDSSLVLKNKIIGVRYTAKKLSSKQLSEKMSKSYSMTISTPRSRLTKAALSPLAIAVDGVIVLTMVPLAVITLGAGNIAGVIE